MNAVRIKKRLSMFLVFLMCTTLLHTLPVRADGSGEPPQPVTVIVDNGDPGYQESTAGQWTTSSLKGYNNSNTRFTYLTDMNAFANWSASLQTSAYKVSIYKVAHSSTDPAARVEIEHAGGTAVRSVNYQEGQSGWVELGTFSFTAGTSAKVKLLRQTPGYNLRADAVKFEPVTNQTTVIDNGDPGYSESAVGQWTTSSLQGYNGSTTRFTYSSQTGSYAQWSASLAPAVYKVSIYKIVHSSSDPAARIQVIHAAGTDEQTINLQSGSSGWVELGTYEATALNSQMTVKLLHTTIGNNLRADAVKFEPVVSTATLTSPGNTSEAPVDTPVVITFSQPMEAATLNGATVKLYEQGPEAVSVVNATYTVASDARSITLQPVDPLKSFTSYKVELSDQIRNRNGSVYNGMFQFGFRTRMAPDVPYLFIRPEQFLFRPGTWTLSAAPGSMSPKVLFGKGNELPETTEPAIASVRIDRSGTYKIWARSRDYSTNQPGTRYFQLGIDGQPLTKVFGQHGQEGFVWELAGTVELSAGTHTLSVLDTSAFYARLDGVFITSDPDFIPGNSYEVLLAIDTAKSRQEQELISPTWITSNQSPAQTVSIENDRVRVSFHEIVTPEGTAIQKQTFLRHENEWLPVDSRTDPYAYLLLYGKDATEVPFDVTDMNYALLSSLGGSASWLVPGEMELIGNREISLEAENELAHLLINWKLPEGDGDPEVTVSLTSKQAGAFSLGMFHGPERVRDEVDSLLLPFQYTGRRLPAKFELVTEHYASTPLSMVTHQAGGISNPFKINYGIAVHPNEIPYRWSYSYNSRFGLTIRSLSGGVLPGLFAPQLGSTEAGLDADDTFEFRYVAITRDGDWFDTYRHTVTSLYGMSDYRENVNSSLTDAIFNMQELVLDDDYAGWDADAKAHYNMEGRNAVSQGSPLTQIQSYLLTEDSDIYERRTIPTLEYMLSRSGLHFSARMPHGGSLQFGGKLPQIGNPVAGLGTSVFGGAYAMTQGQTSPLRQIGIDQGVRGANAYAQIPQWHEQLALYQYTGDSAMLQQAIQGADQYIADVVYGEQNVLPPVESFINISYYPYWQGLLDLYEETGDPDYLDAAVAGARQQMTSVWTNPRIPEGTVTIRPDDILNNPILPEAWQGWWKGDTIDRLGYPENLNLLEEDEIPAWIPARNGLGLEQKSTFNKSGNILMSNWAPDLMRLARHTGDPIYETYARNAMIGRFANYPGYYQNGFMQHQMQEDYPYVGPDTTNIYYHHIPALLGLSVDFLIAQAEHWSNGAVSFPAVRQQGYAYFNNRHFGFAPGNWFDETDMWLWLKPELLTVDHVQADWLAARKDGRFAALLMNESAEDIDVTVQLGTEVTGGLALPATVTLYDASGQSSEIALHGDTLELEVPAHGLIAFALDAPAVAAPAYAKVNSSQLQTSAIGDTVVDTGPTDSFGKGVVLQLDPSQYHAFVYTKFMPANIQQAVLEWRIGDGAWQQTVKEAYPFEFTIPVADSAKSFTYRLKVLTPANVWQVSPDRTLRPYDAVAPETSASVSPAAPEGTGGWHVTPVTVTLNASDVGYGVTSSVYRINSGSWQTYEAPIALSDDGSYIIDYYSVDAAGNTEAAKSVAVNLDSAYGANRPLATSTTRPGQPVLSHNNGHDTGLLDGSYRIDMNMWWGANGTAYYLYENDQLIEVRLLDDYGPAAQQASIDIEGRPNGTYRYVAELVNSMGTTRSEPMTVVVTHAAPGKPVLSHDNWDRDGQYAIAMNMWWGTNGTVFRLYENGVLVKQQLLEANNPGAQSFTVQLSGRAPGTYLYRGELMNSAGSTFSEEITVQVN